MSVLTEQQKVTSLAADSRGGLTALLAGCGILRPEVTLTSLAGRDRVRWLNGMVTNNIRDLTPGSGVYAFVLNPQGHILGDLYVFDRGENLVAEIARGQADTLLQLLRRYIIMDKVEVEDLRPASEVFALTGPQSETIFAAVGVNTNLNPLQVAEVDLRGICAVLVRGDNPSVPNYELWVPKEHSGKVWNLLTQAGAVPVENDTLETFRILCGIPKFGQDIRDRTLPQETGQERALNFTKGCYIGQEIVERIRSRGAVHRTFVGFEIEGPLCAAETKVQSEGREVGEITSVMNASLKGKQLALGYLRREFLNGDKQLNAGDAVVKPVTLPFKDIFA